MRLLITGIAALVLAGGAWSGERCSAIDGDTLRCGRERVRIEGISAPEMNEPGGKQARQRLQQRLQGREIVIERRGRDKHGRTLGRLYVNGQRITQIDVGPKGGIGSRR